MEFEWKHIVIIVDEAEPSEILLRNNFAMVMRETQYRLYLSYKEFNSKFDTSYRNILTSGSKDGRGKSHSGSVTLLKGFVRTQN